VIKDQAEAVEREAKKLISEDKSAYMRVFNIEDVDVDHVLKDLAQFCRAHESTFHADPRIAANLDGRRETWLYIQKYLNLDVEEIYRLHSIKRKQGR
jgi:hypothetical protein